MTGRNLANRASARIPTNESEHDMITLLAFTNLIMDLLTGQLVLS